MAVHAAGGGGVARSDSNTCAYSAGVEILLRGIYADARTEHFLFPEHIEYRTARLGYLFHPLPEAAGGITPGAMDAGLDAPLFWISLAVALAVGGALAFPVNRWLIARGRGHAVIHRYHRHQ